MVPNGTSQYILSPSHSFVHTVFKRQIWFIICNPRGFQWLLGYRWNGSSWLPMSCMSWPLHLGTVSFLPMLLFHSLELQPYWHSFSLFYSPCYLWTNSFKPSSPSPISNLIHLYSSFIFTPHLSSIIMFSGQHSWPPWPSQLLLIYGFS